MAPSTTQPSTAPAVTVSPLVFTYQQVLAAMMLVGWPDADLVKGAAIASAESSRNATAVSAEAGDKSRGYGLWQIEYPTHADLFATWGGIQNGNWIEPSTNAAMALSIRKSQGWGAWTTNNTGAYLAFMPQAQMALGRLQALIASATASNPGLRDQVIKDALYPSSTVHDPTATVSEAEMALAVVGYRTAVLSGDLASTGSSAIAGVSSAAGPPLGGAFQAAAPFASVLDFLNALGRASTWERITLGVVGGGMVLVAVAMIVKPQNAALATALKVAK